LLHGISLGTDKYRLNSTMQILGQATDDGTASKATPRG
jgi:hypothetical protein